MNNENLDLYLSTLILLGTCTNIEPLDFDDEAQKVLLEGIKGGLKRKLALAKNKEDSARIAEENNRLYRSLSGRLKSL